MWSSRPSQPYSNGHPAATGTGAPTTGNASDARLNLLLTYGGWQPDSWADRLPTLLAPMGIQCARASGASDAARLIQSGPFHLAVVDLRLPLDGCAKSNPGAEEGGARVLELLSRLECPPPTLVVRRNRSSRDDTREMEAALRAGAFAVIDQPVDLELMLKVLSRALQRFYRGQWPGCTPPPNRARFPN